MAFFNVFAQCYNWWAFTYISGIVCICTRSNKVELVKCVHVEDIIIIICTDNMLVHYVYLVWFDRVGTWLDFKLFGVNVFWLLVNKKTWFICQLTIKGNSDVNGGDCLWLKYIIWHFWDSLILFHNVKLSLWVFLVDLIIVESQCQYQL